MASTYAGFYENSAFDSTTSKLVASTIVHVYLPNTTTPATLYNSREKLGNVSSISTDAGGGYSFFADPGFYDVKVGESIITRKVYVREDIADTISPDQLNVANGVLGLDGSAKVPVGTLPTIPKAALESSVQTSLNKADSAMQLTSAITTSLGKADSAVQPSSGLAASLAKADTALQLSTPATFESKAATVTAYTLSHPADNGKILGFGAGGSVAITITMPNNLPVGFNVGVVQEGPGRITFATATGGTVLHRQGFVATAGYGAMAGLVVRYNASGTQAAGLIYGDVAA